MNGNYLGPIVKKISEELDRRVNAEIKKYHLTLTQAKVVLFLSEHEGNKATQKELETFLQVSHPTTVTIVKSMEAKHMLETSFDNADRRMKNIALIWGNEEIYHQLREHADRMEKSLFSGLSAEEKEQLFFLLNKVYGNIAT